MTSAVPALRLDVAADRGRVAPGEQRLFGVVELVAGDCPAERPRPALVTALAVDVSGSMRGEPLEQVVRSVERILDMLEDTDRLGVIAFSTNATEVAPVAPLDAGHKRAIRSRVARLRADDRTNVEAGLRLARSSMPPRAEGERHAIVLLSDGEPNVAACTPDELRLVARELREGGVVSTLGYGTRHDENVLLAVADGGGGAYRFVQDPTVCQLELAQAIGAQGDVAVEAIEIVLTPRAGVEIVSVLGAARSRYTAEGLVVPVPDMVARSRRLLAVEIVARVDEARIRGELLDVSARYARAGERARHEVYGRVTVDIGDAPAIDPEATVKVLLVRCDEARGEARRMADRGQFEGAASLLRALMKEIEGAPGYVPADGSPLSEAREQLLDEAMAMERKPQAEALATFKMSTAPKSLAAGDVVASSRSRSLTAARFATRSAGLFPEAYLVFVSGPRQGAEIRLQAQNTIGRTASADIMIASDSVSRRHADVFALEGEFWVADLCSTNATRVNDAHLGSKPHRLRVGDRIKLGDVVLAYREVAR